MHTSKDDYLINTLRFVSRKEASQIYRAVLPECLTSLEMKESNAYRTYLGYATGEVPPKVARKFKKASPSKKESELVPGDEEPIKKGKRLKTPAKKAASKPVTGIELLSEVALSEKAQTKEVRKKSLRDFHKTHPSGSGTVSKKQPSVEKIIRTVTSEGTGDKPEVPDVTNDDSSESESESWGNDEDDSNNEQESSDESSKQENESEDQESDSEQDKESDDDDQKEEEFDQENESEDDEIKSDEEQGMDDIIDQFDDDADARLEEPTKTATGIVQGEGNDTKMTEAQQGNENLETTQEQVVEDAYVTISTVPKKTKVPVTIFRFNDRITSLEKEVSELKKDPLHTQVTSLVDSHLDIRLGETREEFMNFLSESLTARIKEQVKDQQPQILPHEVSNFAPPVIEKLIKESRDEVTLAKVSSQPYSTYEAASTLTEFELKKILLDKMEKSESYLTALEHRDCYDDKDKDEDPSAGSDRGLKKRKTSKDAEPTTGLKKKDSTSGSSKGTKSQLKSTGKYVQSEEPTTKEGLTQTWLMNLAASNPTDKSLKDIDELISTPIDFSSFVLNGLKIKNLTQEILLGPAFKLLKGTRSNYAELEYDFEECYKALSEKFDWENPEGGDYPFDLSKPLPLIKHRKHQKVPFEFFINNDLKYLQGGISTITYTTSTTKKKAAKYDLPGIEDMVLNIWSPVKVAYDRYRILAVTHVKVMRKDGYGYLEEIVVRRDDNALYRFKEGDDVADFAIAVRMFTRSLVIQKQVEDLQVGVESYQKKINVTKPDTTRPDLRKITRTLHTKTLKDSFMWMNTRGIEYRHGVLAKDKMEHIGKEKSSFHDQGHQQAAKGKKDDEKFREIRWW
ncbi:hypothetical protein Tco_0190423 [Tanacetum coccineum]